MSGISHENYKRLRETLLLCGPFANDFQLRTMFAHPSLTPWRHQVPEAPSPADRVDATIYFLLDKYQSGTQKNALTLFLEVLQDRVEPEDTCYERLSSLITALTPFSHNPLPTTSSTTAGTALVPSQQNRSRTFLSYSHKDTKYLHELQTHLTHYIRQDHIDVWDDTRIVPGSLWQTEIENALQSAKVAVLLLSADFLASDFIAAHELPPLLTAAEQRGVTILSVLLRPCAFTNTELAQFQSVNAPSSPLTLMTKAKREVVWTSLAELIWKMTKA